MATTPFVRPLLTQGGTFYTFSSSAEDLALTFNDSTNKFTFSKFALLNIPNIQTPVGWTNTIQFAQPDTAFLDSVSGDPVIVTGNDGIDLAQSFQSYCLNLESTIISDPEYDFTSKQNVSERVFFKWLIEIGAMRFKDADPALVSPTLDQNTITLVDGYRFSQKRYQEGDPINAVTAGVTGYNRVVQYIGELDVVNSVQNNDNAYSEVYVYVPTKDGNTPTVLFQIKNDSNYYEDATFANRPVDPINEEYLQGRNFTETNPSGLTNLAIFDDKIEGSPIASVYFPATGATLNGNWYQPRSSDSAYFTSLDFFTPITEVVTKTSNAQTKSFYRSTLDGICLDFSPSSYQQIQTDDSLSGNTISEFNSVTYSTDFEFNAVLIYYDVYDPNNRSDFATNLYGILFLDNVENTSGGGGVIPRFKKYRPSPVTGLNGNSYGFKINLKFDTDVDQTGIEQAINDYSPYSLALYNDTMNVLQNATSVFIEATNSINSLATQVDEMQNLLITQTSVDSLNGRIEFLENSFASSKSIYDNASQLTNLINQNRNDIDALTKNKTTLRVSYNSDVLKDGNGISIDRSTPDIVKINAIGQEFNITNNNGYGTLNPNTDNYIGLQNFSNYFKHVNNGTSITLQRDLVIKINDSDVRWQLGQSFRLSFGDSIYPGDYNIILLTNALGLYPVLNPSGVSYSTVISTLGSTEFGNTDGKPVFEIVCYDSNNLLFRIDRIGVSIN
jgi:hypothetical protein